MARIELRDGVQDAIIKVAESNPGALSVLCHFVQREEFALPHMLKFDSWGIYGPAIWLAYKDVMSCDDGALYEAVKRGTTGITELAEYDPVLVLVTQDGGATWVFDR